MPVWLSAYLATLPRSANALLPLLLGKKGAKRIMPIAPLEEDQSPYYKKVNI